MFAGHSKRFQWLSKNPKINVQYLEEHAYKIGIVCVWIGGEEMYYIYRIVVFLLISCFSTHATLCVCVCAFVCWCWIFIAFPLTLLGLKCSFPYFPFGFSKWNRGHLWLAQCPWLIYNRVWVGVLWFLAKAEDWAGCPPHTHTHTQKIHPMGCHHQRFSMNMKIYY